VEVEGEVIDRADETRTGVSSSKDEATRVSRVVTAKAMRKRVSYCKGTGYELTKREEMSSWAIFR
jgi:hypothetical protein